MLYMTAGVPLFINPAIVDLMKRVVPSPAPTDPFDPGPSILWSGDPGCSHGSRHDPGRCRSDDGVSKQTLSDLEKATGSVGLAIALKVARELGVGCSPCSPQREAARQALLHHASSPEDGA